MFDMRSARPYCKKMTTCEPSTTQQRCATGTYTKDLIRLYDRGVGGVACLKPRVMRARRKPEDQPGKIYIPVSAIHKW